MTADDREWTDGFDALRPQRLAAPVTVYVERFSAHPLEGDAAHLYAEPDGYVDGDGEFHEARTSDADTPVYAVTLHPDDGLYPLPYMARRSDGRAWEDDAVDPARPGAGHRQPFYPDASRLFEEIDRFEVGPDGDVNQLSSLADFDFYRPVPSGGYTRGLPERDRTDIGSGDIPPEVLGEDYFPYRPAALRREPPLGALADLTNGVQAALSSGRYDGALWLEGSPFVEETSYWLNLLVDTSVPVAACAGAVGSPGAANIIDAVTYMASRISLDDEGRDRVGVVCVQEERIFTSREVQKTDDRPGGFVATGGHGGIVGSIGKPGPPTLTFVPTRRHTHTSQLRSTELSDTVTGIRLAAEGDRTEPVNVGVLDTDGRLLGQAMPSVRILKHARFSQREPGRDDTVELELCERVRRDLRDGVTLIGFVVEGSTPYGDVTAPLEGALRHIAYWGVPVVRVGRGDVGGFVPEERVPFGIAGGNLTATKARMLLMACLLRYGSLTPAEDPNDPTDAEERRVRGEMRGYQHVFDTH